MSSYEEEIENLRKEINQLNMEIVAKLSERVDVAQKIGEVKKRHGRPIVDRIREMKVFCEIIPFSQKVEAYKDKNLKGIILSGGPASVFDENAPLCQKEVFQLGFPVLGICYGLQLIGKMFGGELERSRRREYGKAIIKIDDHIVVVEIKGDEELSEPSDENKAKYRAATQHFDTLNDQQDQSIYYFHFLTPSNYDLFFKYLRDKNFDFVSNLDAELDNGTA